MSSAHTHIISADDSSENGERRRKERKEKKKRKKEKKAKKKRKSSEGDETKKKKRRTEAPEENQQQDATTKDDSKPAATARKPPPDCHDDDKMIQSSNIEFCNPSEVDHSDTTILLFYQYVEPPWDDETYKSVLQKMEHMGKKLGGRMRVAREGLNCTLTGTHKNVTDFCKTLRHFHKGEFQETEFKLTRDLPLNLHFSGLKVMPVQELVNYGMEGEKAPPIDYTGVHLEPKDYHKKLAEDNTVVIDVRNHYEAAIGHFDAPGYVDPKMRKSTEFPLWLDRPETKEKLKGKQVLMYCTGGVRCERASALLKYKMDQDPEIKDLGIQGVYQLQGGIDKYFKEFPDGGYWSGKNYTFDKRFAHAPPKIDGELHAKKKADDDIKGNCEACGDPWDKYRGKRRCPTCGVPSLVCRECYLKDKNGVKKLDRSVRCELCVQEDVRSKKQLRCREEEEMKKYEANLRRKGLLVLTKPEEPARKKLAEPAPNPDGVTKLFLKNMCRTKMDEATLMEAVPGITHIVWRTDRKTGQFFGQGWVEMATPEDAAKAVGLNGTFVLGRPLYISFQPPDGKDRWPPPNSAV